MANIQCNIELLPYSHTRSNDPLLDHVNVVQCYCSLCMLITGDVHRMLLQVAMVVRVMVKCPRRRPIMEKKMKMMRIGTRKVEMAINYQRSTKMEKQVRCLVLIIVI